MNWRKVLCDIWSPFGTFGAEEELTQSFTRIDRYQLPNFFSRSSSVSKVSNAFFFIALTVWRRLRISEFS